MGFISALLRILHLVSFCHGQWWDCGAARIDDKALCFCGNVTITREDRSPDDSRYGPNCCGPDTCTITEDNNANCPDGFICYMDYIQARCGDLRIPYYRECYCGAEQLKSYYGQFCCPSSSPSQCSIMQDGNAKCDGTIQDSSWKAWNKDVKEIGCKTGVCYDRNYFACKSGEECVEKEKMCHGKPICQDYSDLEFCNINNNDVCRLISSQSKCPAISSSEHQECFDSRNEINDSTYI